MRNERMESPLCVVMKLWTHRFWFSTLECNRRMKWSDVTCWIHSTHMTSEMYGCLKSFQTATFFQPKSSLSFVNFLAFFCISYQKSLNLYGTNELSVSKWIIKLNKRIKKIIFISILPSCSVILLNLPCNNVANSIPFKFFLAIKICTRKISLII